MKTIYMIERGSQDRVQSWVSINLNRGWQLNGNVTMFKDGNQTVFAQSMFKILNDAAEKEYEEQERYSREQEHKKNKMIAELGMDGYMKYISYIGSDGKNSVPPWEKQCSEDKIKKDAEYEQFCKIGRIHAERKNERLAKEGGEMFAFVIFVIFLIGVASYFGIRI